MPTLHKGASVGRGCRDPRAAWPFLCNAAWAGGASMSLGYRQSLQDQLACFGVMSFPRHLRPRMFVPRHVQWPLRSAWAHPPPQQEGRRGWRRNSLEAKALSSDPLEGVGPTAPGLLLFGPRVSQESSESSGAGTGGTRAVEELHCTPYP